MSDYSHTAMRGDEFPLDFSALLHIEDLPDLENNTGDILPVDQLNGGTSLQELDLPEESLVANLTHMWSEPQRPASTMSQVVALPSSPKQQQQLVSTSPLTAANASECFPATPEEKTFQFGAQSLAYTSTIRQFPLPSPTPNNTPANTPSVTPDSSNPGSPRGSIYGGSLSRKSPTAKLKMLDSPSAVPSQKIPRHKRESHKRAEQKRRCKIQNGFDEIHRLVPALHDMMESGSKDSKAAVLAKTIDYCRQLRSENKEIDREVAKLREKIEGLTSEIKVFQEELPVQGVTVPQEKSSKPINLDKCFEDYVRARSFQNWKFWIFGLMIQPLFTSFNRMVSTASMKHLYQTTLNWLEEHCSLLALRPAVLNTLTVLSRETSIIATPERLEEEAMKAVMLPFCPRSQTDSSDGATAFS